MRTFPLTLRGTGAVVLALVCFVVAGRFGIPALVYFGVLLLAAVGAALVSLYLLRGREEVRRSFLPDVVSVGDDAEVHVRLRARTLLPTMQGGWRDRLPDGVAGAAAGDVPALSSGLGTGAHEVDLVYPVRAERRGIRPIGPLSLSRVDPFGLARRRHTVGDPTPLTVAPEIVDLPALAEQPGDAGGTLAAATHQLGQGADNLIPRAYVPGDSMRRIHWRSSAHHDGLMVRQEEQESTPEAAVVLDRGVDRYAAPALYAPGADPGFEVAVTAAVSATARLVAEGYDVALVDSDGTPLAEPVAAGDVSGIGALAVALATLTARRDERLAALPRMFDGGVAGPVVLVVGALAVADLDAVGPVAHRTTLPVLLAAGAAPDALAAAREAGWHTAAIGPGIDLAEAWQAALSPGGDRVGA